MWFLWIQVIFFLVSSTRTHNKVCFLMKLWRTHPPFDVYVHRLLPLFSVAANCFQGHKGEQCRWLHRYLNGSLTWKPSRWWFYISSLENARIAIHATKPFNIVRYSFIGNPSIWTDPFPRGKSAYFCVWVKFKTNKVTEKFLVLQEGDVLCKNTVICKCHVDSIRRRSHTLLGGCLWTSVKKFCDIYSNLSRETGEMWQDGCIAKPRGLRYS